MQHHGLDEEQPQRGPARRHEHAEQGRREPAGGVRAGRELAQGPRDAQRREQQRDARQQRVARRRDPAEVALPPERHRVEARREAREAGLEIDPAQALAHDERQRRPREAPRDAGGHPATDRRRRREREHGEAREPETTPRRGAGRPRPPPRAPRRAAPRPRRRTPARGSRGRGRRRGGRPPSAAARATPAAARGPRRRRAARPTAPRAGDRTATPRPRRRRRAPRWRSTCRRRPRAPRRSRAGTGPRAT